MVRIAGKEAWLTQLCAGRVVTHEFYSGIKRLKERMRKVIHARQKEERERAVNAASANRDALPLDTLALDSSGESEEEEEVSAKDVEVSTGRHRGAVARARPRSATAVSKVSLHGCEFSVTFLRRTLYVEATAAAIKAVVTELRVLMVAPPLRQARTRLATKRAATPMDEEKGRLWLANGRYCVMYRAEDGSRKMSVKGLTVTAFNALGQPLQGDAYKLELERVRTEAMRRWNELDRSDKQRFILTACSEEWESSH